MDVASGQITGTTTAMEYSLNSTDGTDGTWTNASATNTSVTLAAGKVYVRQTAVPTNFYLVGTIAAVAAAPTSGVTYDVAAGTVTGLGTTYEYSLNGGETYVTTASGVNFTAGNVLVRTKATATAFASLPQTVGTIALAAGPSVSKAPGTAGGTIKLTGLSSEVTHEYVVDSNPTLVGNAAGWSGATSVMLSGTEIDNIAVDAGRYVHIRVKATATNLASNVQNLIISKNEIKPAAAPSLKSSAATDADRTKLEGLVDGVTYEYIISSGPNDDINQYWNNPGIILASGTIQDNFRAAGYIYIRVKATDLQPASEIQILLVVK